MKSEFEIKKAIKLLEGVATITDPEDIAAKNAGLAMLAWVLGTRDDIDDQLQYLYDVKKTQKNLNYLYAKSKNTDLRHP